MASKIRIKKNKNPLPSVGIIDSQSTKTVNVCEDNIGYDGGKRIKGRKRHIVVDTLGPLLTVVVHSATTHDSKGAKEVLQELRLKYINTIIKIFADGGYRGEIIDWAKSKLGLIIEVVKRSETGKFKAS